MKITVIAVGKIKEKFFSEAIAEYQKRLSRYCKLEIVQVADEKTPDKASDLQNEQIKKKDGAYVIALAINGKMLSSEQLSAELERLGNQGQSQIVMIIGGSLGLSKEVLDRADYKLSFSPMTFPHQLMRVVLLEQVYRGFKIMAGEPYHK